MEFEIHSLRSILKQAYCMEFEIPHLLLFIELVKCIGIRDSVISVPFSNKFNVWSSRFLSRPEFSGLHRNDKLRGWWGVKKGAEAELQHLFLPLTSILIVIPISGENL